MLVMDIAWQRMLQRMNRLTGNRSVFVHDKGTHWEFYIDESENIVLRSRHDKLGGEDDAMFKASLPMEKIVPVQAITWGKHVVVSSLLQETRDEHGMAMQDIAPDEPAPEAARQALGASVTMSKDEPTEPNADT